MKKQTIRKSVSLLLLLTILLVNCGVIASSAYNPGEQIEHNYVHIASMSASLTISGDYRHMSGVTQGSSFHQSLYPNGSSKTENKRL